MINGVMEGFNDEEKRVLIEALTKLDLWFREKEQQNQKEKLPAEKRG